MMSYLLTFQNHVTKLPPLVLLTLGLVTVAAGLFIWLGGLGCKRIMYIVTGAFFGAFCSAIYANTNPLLAAAVIGICAVLSFKLQDTFIVIIVSACAAIIGFSILIRPYFRPSANLIAVMREITIGVPYYNWPILLAITALPFAVVSMPIAPAILSSLAGTSFIMLGAIIVLLYSDFEVLHSFNSKQEIYLLTLVLTVILGIFLQLWILPKVGVRVAAVKKAAKAKVKQIKGKKGESEDTPPKTATWRTA